MSKVEEIQTRIKELEGQVKEEETMQSVLEGKLQVLKDQLKEKFNCGTLEQAEEQLQINKRKNEKLKEEQKELSEQLDMLVASK